jgi:hypothetical protein
MINEVAILDQAGMKALTTAIGVLGPRLAAAAMKPRGRRAEDLAIARWFDTCKITARLPGLPGISAEAAQRLSQVLGGDEIQATLQELLAVRLTDGSDADAERAREAFRLTLSSAGPALAPFGPPLAQFYDDQVCDITGRLEAAEPSMLARIRSEAMSARMIAVLRAIERHTAALSSRPSARSEASFLASYRSHVTEQHGKLEPPDFDRRRRVPIADIYVPAIIYQEISPERTVAPVPADPPTLSVWELAARLDRTVLLGDPGGGKTTASNVLMHYFASDEARRVPFLVTLRNYAAADPPERSVASFIENQLGTFYQCPAPAGLVDMLLLTGRAVVIFDGLDELLDTTRRADVASRVEHFCREYPLAPVLVTSRVVGYDQARLDETQFVSFRLGGFRDEDVEDYARKWFSLGDGTRPGDADAFLSESESVPDLRSNPLLLSLMCILYRGEGSLPRNRAEVYEQCAKLLFKRWDAHRHIHQELRASRYVEAILRHLAWWLFTRENTQTTVTEHELVATTTEFLHGRGFEAENDARDAAREFIEFCRGRMWVFTDAGTSAAGERLYSFTHRTFLEFFAASHLAFDSDSPEDLALTLSPHLARGEWEVVGELAIQVKHGTSSDGAQRIYQALLADERCRRTGLGHSNVLKFLIQSLRSVDPTPRSVRELARCTTQNFTSPRRGEEHLTAFQALLMKSPLTSRMTIADEIGQLVAELVQLGDQQSLLSALRLVSVIPLISGGDPGWHSESSALARKHESATIAAAQADTAVRCFALHAGIISIDQVFAMPDPLGFLFHRPPAVLAPAPRWAPYMESALERFFDKSDPGPCLLAMTAIGNYLRAQPAPPFAQGPLGRWFRDFDRHKRWEYPAHYSFSLTPETFLGAAATFAILAEQKTNLISLAPFDEIYPYIKRRHLRQSARPLPDLSVPGEFKQLLRDWAEGKVNFTAPAPGAPAQNTA